MKIQTEHLQTLQKDEARRKTAQTPEGFEALLSRSMEEEIARKASPAAGTEVFLRGPAPLVPLEGIAPAVPRDQGAGLEIASNLEDLLTGLEDYARQLAADSPDALRSAHALLAKTSGGIASLKSTHPDMAGEQPDLAGVLNELEILAVNETFKFNRGDYL
jgi:hypothetical protein